MGHNMTHTKILATGHGATVELVSAPLFSFLVFSRSLLGRVCYTLPFHYLFLILRLLAVS
jgi:hypothetical protein